MARGIMPRDEISAAAQRLAEEIDDMPGGALARLRALDAFLHIEEAKWRKTP
jgi:hypothetical protein